MKQFIITFDTDKVTITYRGVTVKGNDIEDLCSEAASCLAEDSRDWGVGAVDLDQLEISSEIYEIARRLANEA